MQEVEEAFKRLRQGYFVQFYTKLDAHDYLENYKKPNRFKVWLYGIRVWFECVFHKLMRKH